METIPALRAHAARLPECGEPLEEWSDGAAKLLLLAAKELELAREEQAVAKLQAKIDACIRVLSDSRLPLQSRIHDAVGILAR